MITIYRPINPYPNNIAVDMDLDQDFSVVTDGVKVTDYQLLIYRVSDNAQVYDSTKTTLVTPLSDKETLEHTVTGLTIPNNEAYKFYFTVWNGTENKDSRYVQFNAYTTPVVSITAPTTITTQNYNFEVTYAQAESILPSWWTMQLVSNNAVVEESNRVYDFNIEYSIDGLINGGSYSIKFSGEDLVGATWEAVHAFNVDYQEPLIDLATVVEDSKETSIVSIQYENAVSIQGTATGTVSYINDVFGATGKNLQLDAGAYVSWDVGIPINFTLKFKWKPINISDMKILDLDNGDYEFGYALGRFYAIINGITYEGLPHSISISEEYYIILRPTNIKIVVIT